MMTRENEVQQTSAFVLEKVHLDHINDVAIRFKEVTGVQISRSAALRKILEEHKALTTAPAADAS